ncbi:hypothetical protein SAMN05216184_10485 [Georgenia satyanarayanai]|uniref:Uncharacterized protein n=1 Tax=Georgenia satyanarayanai TaxID=860221 RepID=A0A2Y9ADH8_9MICO|nr:hypothetical protein [Georgenia satyanarayanai]PYG00146.1 hypothetical protein A8987_10485 [Georgenia satyanarayanai]SSA40347.1 hypothetical protein SAMN05216184_10485 [Georgenia satyanarayanai]
MSPTALPPDVTYGYVADRILRGVMDTDRDSDDLPDGIPAQGTVTFTPAVKVMAAGEGKTTVLREDHVFHIHQGDDEPPGTELPAGMTKSQLKGLLVSDQTGKVSPHALITGVWTVTYRLTGGVQAIGQIQNLHVTEEFTRENPMWVREHAAMSPTPVERWVVNEYAIRQVEAILTEKGSPGGIAPLNDDGKVVDADGNVVGDVGPAQVATAVETFIEQNPDAVKATWDGLTGKPPVVAAGTTQAAARSAIAAAAAAAAVPTGGLQGQVLRKKTVLNHDLEWTDPPAGGGGPVDYDDVPTGSTFSVAWNGTAWPAQRPSSRTDINFIFRGGAQPPVPPTCLPGKDYWAPGALQ